MNYNIIHHVIFIPLVLKYSLDVLEFCHSVPWQYCCGEVLSLCGVVLSLCGEVLSLCDEICWLPVVFPS